MIHTQLLNTDTLIQHMHVGVLQLLRAIGGFEFYRAVGRSQGIAFFAL